MKINVALGLVAVALLCAVVYLAVGKSAPPKRVESARLEQAGTPNLSTAVADDQPADNQSEPASLKPTGQNQLIFYKLEKRSSNNNVPSEDSGQKAGAQPAIGTLP